LNRKNNPYTIMKTAITLSLLPTSPKRPFVLGPEPRQAFRIAAELGFDAIEVFPPTLEAFDAVNWQSLVDEFGIGISTVGTGGGAVSQGLTLTDADANIRVKARDYVSEIVARAADLGANAIIGSMQGRAGNRNLAQVLRILVDELHVLARSASDRGRTLLFEPLNRYESDLACTLDDAAELVDQTDANNLELLADLFHMNIEETGLAETLAGHLDRIGHVHFVDSNRRSAGLGHSDLKAVWKALVDGGYRGYLAVEAFPLPDQESAARQAAKAFRQLAESE
jgi:sugar phosphate isomerase/epimerase